MNLKNERGMFGSKIKAPGSTYWFSVSLLFLVVMAINSLSSGSFPGVIVMLVLFSGTTYGWAKPYVNAENQLTSKNGFISFSLIVCAIANVQTHINGQVVNFSGMMTVLLSGIVGFYLGRYIRINRLSFDASHEEIQI